MLVRYEEDIITVDVIKINVLLHLHFKTFEPSSEKPFVLVVRKVICVPFSPRISIVLVFSLRCLFYEFF